MLYYLHQFTKEEHFEAQVVALADRIFGEQTIYLDIKKKLRWSEFSIIPDGEAAKKNKAARKQKFTAGASIRAT